MSISILVTGERKMRIRLHNIKKETIKLLGSYLGFSLEVTPENKFSNVSKIETPDSYDTRLNRTQKIHHSGTRYPL